MIKVQRHIRILSLLQREGTVSIEGLRNVMPEVAAVTLRRDLSELAEKGALRRRHGGAILPDASLVQPSPQHQSAATNPMVSDLEALDAVILPPVMGRGSDALRRDIVRRGIHFIAESAPQQGGIYLGPDNRGAATELGRMAAVEFQTCLVVLLTIGLPELANTRDRVQGFEEGLTAGGRPPAIVHRVNGQGSYKASLRVAHDAFMSDENINMVFAVNDHAAIAGIEAAERLGRPVTVYSMGGESPAFMGRLAANGPLRGVCALFPEVVGRRGIDLALQAMLGQTIVTSTTPHAIVTAQNLDQFYVQKADGWQLREKTIDSFAGVVAPMNATLLRSRKIGFLPHYPAHEWYRNMASAMQSRCLEYGASLVVTPPHQGITAEISRLRREIARSAANMFEPDMVAIIGEGETNVFLAEEIRSRAFADDPNLHGVTIITNALDVLYTLEAAPNIKVILTSGEYQKSDRCLVGPSLGAIFDRIRPHMVFLAVEGVTTSFGISAMDERRALAAQRFVNAAQRTVALADSVTICSDASHRIVGTNQIHDILTDDGALPADRQAFRAAGVEVTIAGEAMPEPRNDALALYQRRN